MNTTTRTHNEEARLRMGPFYDKYLFWRGAAAGFMLSADRFDLISQKTLPVQNLRRGIEEMSGDVLRTSRKFKTLGLIAHDRYITGDKRELLPE